MHAAFVALLLLPGLAAAQLPAPPPAAEPVLLLGTYQYTGQPDSTDKASVQREIMFLALGKTLSRFESLGQHLQDSVSALPDDPANSISDEAADVYLSKLAALPHSNFNDVVYKHTLSRQLWLVGRVTMTAYHYPEATPTWVITPATATLSGYACQRATTTLGGRTWEAWFTREVPVSEGPYKFAGLPGLIVQVADTRHYYRFELLSLRPVAAGQQVRFPAKTTAITRAAFRQAQADYNRDPIGRRNASASDGSYVTFTPSNPERFRRNFQERLRKRNNPLELR
ncbi:MAG: GLPGLI family protein [Janthinobacterium lividum]